MKTAKIVLSAALILGAAQLHAQDPGVGPGSPSTPGDTTKPGTSGSRGTPAPTAATTPEPKPAPTHHKRHATHKSATAPTTPQ